MEITRGKAAKQYRRVGVQTFDDFGDFDRAVGMRQPVQVDAEDQRIQLLDVVLDVKIDVVEHAHRQVDDAGLQIMAFQILGHGGKANRVHLEDRGGRHQVADRSIKDRFAAEIIHAGSVEKSQDRELP